MRTAIVYVLGGRENPRIRTDPSEPLRAVTLGCSAGIPLGLACAVVIAWLPLLLDVRSARAGGVAPRGFRQRCHREARCDPLHRPVCLGR
jgi:hypothetical protein